MKTIGICATSRVCEWRRTFGLLGGVFGVSFEERALGDEDGIEGWIALAADRKLASEITRSQRPCYVVLDDSELIPGGGPPTITFADTSELDAVLRRRRITADDAEGAKALPEWLSDVAPLAFKDGLPVWASRGRGGCRHQFVSLAPPALDDSEALFAHFSGRRLVRLLPLVLFIRSLLEEGRWEPPPLQAAFMFDDPNLHWTTYGFIDYREMVRHAVAGDYHVSFATIPFDAWFAYGPAISLFREHARRISLLYHGNDHLSNELGRALPADAMQQLLRQAVWRIARLEARTGLEIARVMAPPHGACGGHAIAEMARVGFEALCVSRGSLRYHNHGKAWTSTLGFQPCDVIGGLPVIPRFRLSEECRNDIVIAALLRQPIVPVTHHQALANGYELLDETAAFVNSLGTVAWRDMKTMSRSLYSSKRDAGTLVVRMLSKRISVPICPGTTEVAIERRWPGDSSDEALFWRANGDDRRWKTAPPRDPVPVSAGATLEIASGRPGTPRAETPKAVPHRFVPLARRLLTEGRDRALPSLRRIVRSGRALQRS